MNGERRPAPAAGDGLSDAQLLREIADGDVDSLGALFDRHHERVTRVLRRSGMAPSDVDDLVQQTFLQVPRVAAAYDGRDSCAAWLCGIAVRLGARRRRSIVRLIRALTAFTTEVRVATDLDPERILAGREEFAIFAAALAKLGRKKREAFVLIEIEGFTAEEAGRALGVPAATLRTRLFHARGELRAAMEEGDAMTKSCHRLWEVDALRDGRLVGADAASHRRHAEECVLCRERLSRNEQLAQLGRELPAPAPDDIRIRRLRADVLRLASGQPRRGGAWRAVVLAALAFAIAAGALPLVRRNRSVVPAARAPTADAERTLSHRQPDASESVEAPPVSPPAAASRRAVARPAETGRDTSEYEGAVAAYAAHEYADAARRCAVFVVAHPDAPETEDATFLEASSLAHDGRADAAGAAAERYLVRYGRSSFHARDAAVLAARAARDRAECQRARELLAPWSASSAPEVVKALGSCRE